MHAVRDAVEAAKHHGTRSEDAVLTVLSPETTKVCSAIEACMRHGIRVRSLLLLCLHGRQPPHLLTNLHAPPSSRPMSCLAASEHRCWA